MNRTKASVVRRMDVSDFKAGSFSRQTSRPQSRQSAQMFQLRQNIFLLHELRKLVGGEKFLESRLQWLWGNKLHRLSEVRLHRGHPVLYVSFYLRHSHPDLLL